MNDEQLIWERYKLMSEMPASLEFMGDDPETISKLDPKFMPVTKSNPAEIGIKPKSIRSDINAWGSEKAKSLMRSTVEKGTAKGLDKRRQTQGKPPLLWRLVDANLEQLSHYEWNDIKTKNLIQKGDLESLVNNNPSVREKLHTPNGITVIMTPSGQEERSGMMAFSSWIRSHKCGHAILDITKNFQIGDNITRILQQYHSLFKESLRMASSLKNIEQEYPILNSIIRGSELFRIQKYYSDPKNFYCKLFTFGSARNGQLLVSDKNEELVAQLMQTGKITFNKMLDEKTIQMFIQDIDEQYTKEEMNTIPGLAEIKKSRMNLLNVEEYIADQIDQAIENCIGDILFDVILT